LEITETEEEEEMNQDSMITLSAEVNKLKEELNRWRNIAGIMHEAIQEGDCEGARIHYEENCRAW